MTVRLKRFGTPLRAGAAPRSTTSLSPGSRTAHGDPRWPRIAAALGALREEHRHAVRIVDADCACGALLIETVRYAHGLGFTAIEGRGIDGSPAMIGRARAAATRLHDPAIGLEFELADMMQALTQEAAFPADIMLWHGTRDEDNRSGLAAALAAAGDLVIGDPAPPPAGERSR